MNGPARTRDDEVANPAVTVVIPTIGRPSLADAVRSALAQRGVVCQVLVVADLREASASSLGIAALAESADVGVTVTGGGRGGGYARAMGTDAATHDWVAYLDDDDVWMPDKLERQLEAASGFAGYEPIVSCRLISRAGGRTLVAPRTPYAGGDVAAYLFHRRRLGADRNLIHTSTLLCRTELARSVGWNTDLVRHQDWDFVLRAVQDDRTRLVQLDAALVESAAGSVSSVSSSVDWRTSLEWARSVGGHWPRTAYADFLVGQPLRYALMARSAAGVRTVLRECARSGRPSSRALALGAAGLVPRGTLLRAMHAQQRGTT